MLDCYYVGGNVGIPVARVKLEVAMMLGPGGQHRVGEGAPFLAWTPGMDIQRSTLIPIQRVNGARANSGYRLETTKGV
jgi:hypothetical protein